MLHGKWDQDCDLWLPWNFSFRLISMMNNVQLLQETISFAYVHRALWEEPKPLSEGPIQPRQLYYIQVNGELERGNWV